MWNIYKLADRRSLTFFSLFDDVWQTLQKRVMLFYRDHCQLVLNVIQHNIFEVVVGSGFAFSSAGYVMLFSVALGHLLSCFHSKETHFFPEHTGAKLYVLYSSQELSMVVHKGQD